jgi:hypothetical protein
MEMEMEAAAPEPREQAVIEEVLRAIRKVG